MATSSTVSGKKQILVFWLFVKADECVKPSSQPETRDWNLSLHSVCNPSSYPVRTQMLTIWRHHRQLFPPEHVLHTRNYCIVSSLYHRPSLLAFLWLADSCCLLGSLSLHFAPWTSAAFLWTLRIVLWSWRAVSMKLQQGDVSVWNYGHVLPPNTHKNPLYIMCWLENTLHNLSFNLDDVMRLHLPPMNRFS